ncbi:MAG: phosphoglycerate mutase (2,3-diphosphoglycerate-independent) [Acidobacteria bacterium RIFCSPLOWO2_02_FULL_61_28]|nr:MAG: phosphoglycerate mutase (2,3-diphosphoglycerate-independent) [Acidobacteria bacterium RIFCSPLOWO2_02_FULL_61_28]
MPPKPLLLIILDGWGFNPSREGNAIALARKPTWDQLNREFPHTLIHTSGPFVGLPEGQMGNSEVGHLNIGSGRIIHMDITRLDRMIQTGEFFRQPLLVGAMEHARNRWLHLLGLVSDGGVHSQQEHLYALLRLARMSEVHKVFVHAFLDGRDTPPTSGAEFLEKLRGQMQAIGVGTIATVSGRYYAMDRDKRWERTEKAYAAMVLGQGVPALDPIEAVHDSYDHGVTDEFVVPIVMTDQRGQPLGTIRSDDAVIFFNFRADRARQITRALTDPALEGIPRSSMPQRLHYVCMTQYDKTFNLPYVLGPHEPQHILANILAEHGLRNLRVAETEKYAHVTYFFNGGVEKAYPGEERILVPSPKVATYDLKPEMNAEGITAAVVKAVEGGTFDFLIINFANADMVGHSGKLEAAIRAVEAVDASLGRIYAAVRRAGGAMIITADHGNAELMIDPVTGGPHTYHTTNPVPFVFVSADAPAVRLRDDGSLRDIAPTLLGVAGIPPTAEMTGHDLRIPGGQPTEP